MRWLVKGRVNKRDIKTAVELLKENIARLKDIQDDLYFTAMYEYMDDRFFLDLESAYLSSGMNVDSLSILLRKAMQRHTRRLKNRYKDADSEKPERWDMFLESLAQRNRIWGRKKLSLYGYLLHKEWLRKGTHDAARPDIKKELVKLGEINSGERKDSVSSMEKKSGFRVFAAAHAISFAAAVNGNGNVRSTLKGRLPTDAFLMSFRPDTAWLPKENDGFHNIAHLARVLVMAELLIRVRGLSGEEANAVRWAAVTHDIKRAFAEGNAEMHGDLSADWAMRNPQVFVTPNSANTEAIAYLNRWHAREDSDCPEMTDSLKIVKDADALDRARLKDLDPRYLRLEESHGLIYFAQELYNLSKKIIRGFDVPEFEAVILAGKILGIVEGSITLEGCRQENNPKAQRRYSDRAARCSV